MVQVNLKVHRVSLWELLIIIVPNYFIISYYICDSGGPVAEERGEAREHRKTRGLQDSYSVQTRATHSLPSPTSGGIIQEVLEILEE